MLFCVYSSTFFFYVLQGTKKKVRHLGINILCGSMVLICFWMLYEHLKVQESFQILAYHVMS